MKTKAQIIGQLLQEGKINGEDAVILLHEEVKYVYINTPYYVPTYLQPPYVVTVGTGSGTTLYNTLTNN